MCAPLGNSTPKRLDTLCCRGRLVALSAHGCPFAFNPVPVIVEGGVEDVLLRLVGIDVLVPAPAPLDMPADGSPRTTLIHFDIVDSCSISVARGHAWSNGDGRKQMGKIQPARWAQPNWSVLIPAIPCRRRPTSARGASTGARGPAESATAWSRKHVKAAADRSPRALNSASGFLYRVGCILRAARGLLEPLRRLAGHPTAVLRLI